MLPRHTVWKLIRWWPPYFGAGIRVASINRGITRIEVHNKLRWWNRNVMGVHFGGSIYAMCDPFFMLILMENLGPDYIVWDKAAQVEFLRPGKGTIQAVFELSPDEIARVKNLADTNYKVEPEYDVEVIAEDGTIVARVHKVLYVRRKDRDKQRIQQPRAAPMNR